MKDADLQLAPVKAALDDAPEPPRWWQRLLWGVGCGLAAIVMGFLHLGITAGVISYFDLRLGWLDLSLMTFVVLEAFLAGIVGMVVGVLFPGFRGLGVTVATHSVCTVLFAGLLLIGMHQELRIFSSFFLAAAPVSGAIAILLLRMPANEPDDLGAGKSDPSAARSSVRPEAWNAQPEKRNP